MALQRRPKTLWEWLTQAQPVTWCLHGAFTLAVPLILARATWQPLFPWLVATAALAYVAKEIFMDWREHCRKGDQRTRDWLGIDPLVDGFADAGFPCMVAIGVNVGWWLR